MLRHRKYYDERKICKLDYNFISQFAKIWELNIVLNLVGFLCSFLIGPNPNPKFSLLYIYSFYFLLLQPSHAQAHKHNISSSLSLTFSFHHEFNIPINTTTLFINQISTHPTLTCEFCSLSRGLIILPITAGNGSDE